MTNDNGDCWYIDDIKIDGKDATSLPVVADFSATPTQVCVGNEVSFTDLSTNTPTSWEWDFGDGTPSVTEQNPKHIYTTAGTYTVSLSASNADGGDIKTMNNYITVVATPNAGTDGTLEICEGTTPSNEDLFNALGGNPDSDGTWSNNGLVYTYSLTNDCGTSTATVTVTEKPLPKANFTIVEDNSPVIKFSNTSTNASTYLWNLGDGTTSQDENVEHTYTANGSYTINLQSTNDCGNSEKEETLTIGTVGFEGIAKASIKIYPNPANDYVKIDLGKDYNQVKSVAIVNSFGQTLYLTKEVNQSVLNLSVKDLNSGVYFVRVLSNKGVFVLELVILK